MNTERPTFKCHDTLCYVNVGSYANDPMIMSIFLVEAKDLTPYTKLSVNFGYLPFINDSNFTMQLGHTFINHSGENHGSDQWLIDNGLAKPCHDKDGIIVICGDFTEYLLMKFDLDALKKADPEGFAKYEKGYHDKWNELQIQNKNLYSQMEQEERE